jgi:hypothetical protein
MIFYNLLVLKDLMLKYSARPEELRRARLKKIRYFYGYCKNYVEIFYTRCRDILQIPS